MKITIYIYRLTDYEGNQTVKVYNDPNAAGYLSGYDNVGKFREHDVSNMSKAHIWAEQNGMKLESCSREIDITDQLFA